MVTIRKQRVKDGFYFEIADFAEYVRALENLGRTPPAARYRVFISFDDEAQYRNQRGDNDLREQIALFFGLSAESHIPLNFEEN